MKKWLIILIVLALAGGGAYAYFTHSGQDQATGPKTVTVSRGTIVEKALAMGEILPRHEVAVKSKISGTVAKLFVEDGDPVKEGEPLLEVKPSPTPLEYAQSKRTLEMRLLVETQRQADLERTKGLLERGMVSQSEYDKAREAFEQAALQRRLAEEELAILDKGKAVVAGRSVESLILSPVAGSILKLNVAVGDPVVPLTSYQPGTELLTLADMSDLLFKGTVDEIDVGKIREGMPVELKVGAFPDKLVQGVLSRISLKSQKKDNATVFEVEITQLQVPEDMVLRAGYSANADIVIRRAAEVLLLPERVVEFRGDSTLVRLPAATADAPPEERLIKAGMSDGINLEVQSGLEEGAVVLEKETKEIK
ncbi:MAG: efflux RND transporter periplasmic adaptor subunit [Candidatus Latescibacteria bacterium]|nr:efflux RND transporter periplasmic adaptor subunit [Candidatus Latescibacterota bacterium]